MTVCCEHNRCPDRPTHWLRRFRTRPWFCDQCGRLWVTVPKAMNDHRWWEWRDLTVSDPKPEPPPTSRIVLSPAAGEQTLTNKTIVVDEAHRLADIDLDPNPFRRTGTDAERQWQQADDKTTTKFRVTANVYPSPFAEKTCAVATWTGTRFQIGEMAGEYADESDNPLLHMEIGTVEVLADE